MATVGSPERSRRATLMAQKKVEILSNSYLKLLTDLKSILIEGLLKAQAAVVRQKVQTYWRAGELISEHILENKERAGYGKRLYINLARELDSNEDTLERMVKFYRLFPLDSIEKQLEWTHYRNLITVDDKIKRNSFLKQAVRQDWNSRELRKAIRIYKLQLKGPKKALKPIKAPKITVTRGKLYTYRLVKPKLINLKDNGFLIDCGFNIWDENFTQSIKNPYDSQIVSATKIGGSASGGESYKLKPSDAASKDLHTYKAFVEDVVDGDTIWVNIDLGFRNWYRINLRFRGIDAPEMSTKKGVRVKEFVEATLSKCPFIVIRSTELGKYGRPISDIFYMENEPDPHVVAGKGIFLNQQLLDLGLAKLMED